VIKDVTDVLREQPGLIELVGEAFLAWKFVSTISKVADAVKGISVALGLIGPAAATAGVTGAAGLAPLTAILANPVVAAIIGAGAFGAGIGPLLNASTDKYDAKLQSDFLAQQAERAKQYPAVPAVIGPQQTEAGPGIAPSGPITAVTPPSSVAPVAPLTPGNPFALPPRAVQGPGITNSPFPVAPPTSATPVDPKNPFAGFANGGVLPGYSPGRDNMLVPMSGGEGVIIPTITRQLGPRGIAAINGGALTRGYATGGIVDPFGNPVTPGAAPGPGGFVPGAGPAPIAPGGGIGDIFGSILQGLGGPISNVAALGSSFTGSAGGSGGATPSLADRFSSVPGLFGLIGSAASSNPADNLANWGKQTGEFLGNFTAKTVGGFATTLLQGALGFVGLDNSILSPNNPWNQAGQSIGQFAFSSDGPLGKLLGANPGAGSGAAGKGPTDAQLRDAGQKVDRADQKVALIQK
ncbi:MAG: hypothetical protein ACRDUB_20145, partial [Mycobacterium sp.]